MGKMIKLPDIKGREDVQKLVDHFYARVLVDEKIGFIFTHIARINLEQHMPVMYDFWETTLFHSSAYKGNPIQVHLDLHKKSRLEKEHFDRWLQLFNATINELFEGEKAELAKTRALSIATVMQIKISQSGN
jgi:hemoglobin